MPLLWGREVCVALCLDGQFGSSESVAKIIRIVSNDIAQTEAGQRIKIKVLPGDAIRSARDADRYMRWTGVPLVIWGAYRRFTRSGAEVDQLVSCRLSPKAATRIIKCERLRNYTVRLQERLTEHGHKEVRCSDTVCDLPRACADYQQMIVGMMAPLCWEAGDPLSAAKLAEMLLERLCNSGTEAQLRDDLRKLIAESLQCYMRWNPDLSAQQELAALNWLAKYASLNKGMLARAAWVAWYAKDIAAATRYTEEIERIDPGNSVAALNFGFLAIVNREYGSACYWYREAIRRYRARPGEAVLTMTTGVIAEQIEREPHEIGYRFASGMVNCSGVDVAMGKSDLRWFINRAKNLRHYESMLQCASKMLEEVSARKTQRKSGTKRAQK